jgi:hypothetical protein
MPDIRSLSPTSQQAVLGFANERRSAAPVASMRWSSKRPAPTTNAQSVVIRLEPPRWRSITESKLSV